MAELAFETIIRVFLALIVLALLSMVINQIVKSINTKIEQEKNLKLPSIIDGSSLTKDDVISYAELCRSYYMEHVPSQRIEPCFVFKNISYDALNVHNESLLIVKRKTINAVMSYDVYNDKVVIE